MDNQRQLERLLLGLRRQAWWIVLVAAVVAVGTFFVSRQQPPTYQATARLVAAQPSLVNPNTFSGALPTANALDGSTYREAALGNDVLQSLVPQVQGLVDEAALRKIRTSVRARTVDGRQSTVIALSVTSRDPQEAARLANLWAESLRNWENDRVRGNFTRMRTSLQAQLETVIRERRPGQQPTVVEENLRRDLDVARALEQSATGLLSGLEQARPPLTPVAPRPARNAALAFLLALFGLLGLAVLRGSLDTRVKDSQEAHLITGLPILGEFPKLPPSHTRELPREAVSYLRTNVNHGLMDEEKKVILVTSSEASEGKSSVSVSLAKAYARAGKRTVLLDFDTRRPVLHTEWKVERGPDIVDTLRDPFMHMAPVTVEKNLDLVPCFSHPDDPAELLTTTFRQFIKQVSETSGYQVIIVDSPPLLPVADTLIMAPHVSGVVVACHEGRTTSRRLLAALDMLRRVGARVVGLAVTNITHGETYTTMFSKYRRYGYGYGYGYNKSPAEKEREKGETARRA
ncbi:MAG: Wzz/FepE/Etk N-terminal domain-containing protein [Meiothermus sp.]|nr:Wzz/FepE/Etk N-terminal domain-containing protein [Meiothermus sp.]